MLSIGLESIEREDDAGDLSAGAAVTVEVLADFEPSQSDNLAIPFDALAKDDGLVGQLLSL